MQAIPREHDLERRLSGRVCPPPPAPDVFLTQFSALQTSRSVRTRRLAAAEENTEVTRTARLAHIFKEICDMITSYKGLCTRALTHTHEAAVVDHTHAFVDDILNVHYSNIIQTHIR